MRRPELDSFNQFISRHKANPPRFPENLLIETVARCNLKCVMCPQSELSRPAGVISDSLWQRIIDEVAATAPKTNIWPAFMGEAFVLGKRKFELLKYATSRGLTNVNLNTNLLLFKEDWADELFDSGIANLIVSCDGATANTYESIRVQGKYEVLMKKLHFILDEKQRRKSHLPITLQFIVMEENAAEEQLFLEYWKQSGHDIKLKIKPRIGWSDGVDPYKEMITISKDERIPCTWLLRQMVVFWDGRVPQCTGDWDGKTFCGDVTKNTISEIWNTTLLERRKNHLTGTFSLELCQGCSDWQAGTSVSVDIQSTKSDAVQAPTL